MSEVFLERFQKVFHTTVFRAFSPKEKAFMIDVLLSAKKEKDVPLYVWKQLLAGEKELRDMYEKLTRFYSPQQGRGETLEIPSTKGGGRPGSNNSFCQREGGEPSKEKPQKQFSFYIKNKIKNILQKANDKKEKHFLRG